MKHTIPHIYRRVQGFSLIELLIAMTLMAFLVMGTAQLICHSLLVKCKSDCTVRAAELAGEKLEHLRSLAFNGAEENDSQLENLRDAKNNQNFRREWKSAPVSPEMRRIEISCFASNYPEKGSRVVLLLTRELGF